jgi:hypothetical protein
MGKASFLIAGYNTASRKEKEKYDEKKLCRVMGSGLAIITIIMGINVAYAAELPGGIQWLMPWGFLVTVAAMIVLANTICKRGNARP